MEKNNVFKKAVESYLSRRASNDEQKENFEVFYDAFNKTKSAESAFWLGRCYLFGKGTGICYSKANELLRIATKSEEKEIKQIANYFLAMNYRAGLGVENAHDHEFNKIFANQFLLKSAEAGYDQAQYETGIRALFGVDMKKDEKLGVHMLMKASNPKFEVITKQTAQVKGFSKAQKMLSFCYQYGVGIEKDPIKSTLYFRSAQMDENEISQNKINKYVYDIDAELEKFVAKKKAEAPTM